VTDDPGPLNPKLVRRVRIVLAVTATLVTTGILLILRGPSGALFGAVLVGGVFAVVIRLVERGESTGEGDREP
jgi:hypothetical protein